MVKSRRLLGLQVIDIENGRAVGRVSRLIFDPRARRVSAFIVASGHWPAEDHVLEWNQARGVGQHAITIRGTQALVRPASLPELQPLLRRPLRLYGTRVLTEDGEFLGSVEELLIDPRTGEVTQVILAPNGLVQRLRGRSAIPADSVLVMGEDAMVVRAATAVQPSRLVQASARNGQKSNRPAGDDTARPDGAAGDGHAAAGGDGQGHHAAQASESRSGSRQKGALAGQVQAVARRGWQVLRRGSSRHRSSDGEGRRNESS